MMLTHREQVINNVLYGVAYGYQNCCIHYFHIRQFNGDMFKDNGDRKLTGTGFICCPECDENVSADKMIEGINDRRLVDTKFPEDMKEIIDLNDIDFSTDDIKRMNELIPKILTDLNEYTTLL